MDAWMTGYIEGKLAAAQYFEENIKGSFDPHQVAIILRAFADITGALERPADAGMMMLEELDRRHYCRIIPAWPPKMAQIEQLLHKLEKGKATAIEIEEFRRLADEVLRKWEPDVWSPKFKERIESALSLLP
jgi:hypothetical protein